MRGESTLKRIVAAVALVAALTLVPAWAPPAEALYRSSVFVEAYCPLSPPATTTTDPAVRPLAERARFVPSFSQQNALVGHDLAADASPAPSPDEVVAPKSGVRNRGLIYVLEGGNQRVHPRVSAADVFEDSLPGAYSDVASGRRVVPALGYDAPASLKAGARNPYIRFDGVDPLDAQLLIDRKLSLVRFPTGNGPMIPQAVRIRETLLALDQNPGFRVVYEFPDAAAARSARSILREIGVADPRLTVRIAR